MADDADDAEVPPPPPYPEAEPPALLYHAVPPAAADRVWREGLSPSGRPHVHLARKASHARSAIRGDAGEAVLLQIDAAAMSRDGFAFYVSPKATWLTTSVPPRYLSAC